MTFVCASAVYDRRNGTKNNNSSKNKYEDPRFDPPGFRRPEPDAGQVQQIRDSLQHCVETDAEGRCKLSLNLPDAGSLDQIAKALALLIQP
jgi:hypothetical protein